MAEKLYTIPLHDAFMAGDECPFCYIERQVEQNLLDFVLGSSASYMERDIRNQTDQLGFCKEHYHKMFSYGNSLGNAWMLKTHYMRMQEALDQQIQHFQPRKRSFMSKSTDGDTTQTSLGKWCNDTEKSCYICKQSREANERYFDTFFHMYKTDPSFVATFEKCKGFCLPHFGQLSEQASQSLSSAQQKQFYPVLFTQMQDNLARIAGDISWFIDKYDYRNREADWKDSKDALQRGMQKLKGGYPADPPYQQS